MASGSAVAANRLLWEGSAGRGRTLVLTALAFADGAACDRAARRVGFGGAAELLRRTGGQQADRGRRAEGRLPGLAAAPLVRCSDPAIVTATEQRLNALADVENTAPLAALEAFGRAVNATAAPQLS
ncbi:hypothetical protein ACFXDI_47115 [Streptomyces mirabilis]|uniref:hypothetical protein n=1 Tax=Streptomyces mirabilis TaxID=68239 RepID=UPI0036BFBE48